MAKHIVIIQGHPDRSPERFCRALASAYETGARTAGHEVPSIDARPNGEPQDDAKRLIDGLHVRRRQGADLRAAPTEMDRHHLVDHDLQFSPEAILV